jgi:hypothetical protein
MNLTELHKRLEGLRELRGLTNERKPGWDAKVASGILTLVYAPRGAGLHRIEHWLDIEIARAMHAFAKAQLDHTVNN